MPANLEHLSYCPQLPLVLERLRGLYGDRDMSLVLATMNLPSPALRAFAERHPAGPCDYPDPVERIAFWDEYLRERAGIPDDSVPSAYLTEMDQGLYGGLLGGDVQFTSDPDTGWISSMMAPLLHDWAELSGLRFDPQHEWFQRYLHQLQVFVEGAGDRFGTSHFILINGLNFVFELVGATRTYMDLIERPETVCAATTLAWEVNRAVQRAFFAHAPLVCGGTCSNMLQWVPGRILSESVDPFHMTSVDYFEQWGRPVLEQAFAEFDGGGVHIHGNGRHLLEAVASVRDLKGLWLGDDRGFPPAFEVVGEIRRRVGNLPLNLDVDYAPFVAALRAQRLTGGVIYRVRGVPDAEIAARTMDLVRAYRA
ncbi:MAG TPA: hypothetical protein VGM19_03540 [Armatimonadota bacterium]|jgi:hypothetical protein